jgi:hypothetical protein
MEDVPKTYEGLLSKSEPVVGVDEKPVVLHEDTRPPIPMQRVQVARWTMSTSAAARSTAFSESIPKRELISPK